MWWRIHPGGFIGQCGSTPRRTTRASNPGIGFVCSSAAERSLPRRYATIFRTHALRPFPPLDHSRPWTQWHALTLLFGLCRLCGGLQIVVRAPDGGFRQRFGGGDRGLDGRGAGLRRAVGRGVAGRDLSPRRGASVGWLASIDAIESVGLVGEWRPAGARARCGLLVASWLCCVVCACQQPAAG